LISKHSIRVLGRELQLKSASTSEHVAQVEALVNEKLAEAEAVVSSGDSQIVVILAMMHLAEACLTAQKEIDKERSATKARISGIIGQLEQQAV
jgi:cell division protein ZapA